MSVLFTSVEKSVTPNDLPEEAPQIENTSVTTNSDITSTNSKEGNHLPNGGWHLQHDMLGESLW